MVLIPQNETCPCVSIHHDYISLSDVHVVQAFLPNSTKFEKSSPWRGSLPLLSQIPILKTPKITTTLGAVPRGTQGIIEEHHASRPHVSPKSTGGHDTIK